MTGIINAKDIVSTVLVCPTCGADVTALGHWARCCNHDGSTFIAAYRTRDGSYHLDTKVHIIYDSIT
jgi:hypothetical protein